MVTGLLAAAIPTMFTVSITGMLLTGTDAEHRFHQLTGQGLLLTALWLGALLPLLVAGWRGSPPSTATGLRHVVLVAVGAALAVVSPGGGAPFLVGVAAVTGALLWLALPRRPRLRGLTVRVDRVLAPAAVLTAAVWGPYAAGQLALQRAATGYHAQNPHLYDMAWVVTTLTVLAVLAALLPAARRLMAWTAVGSVVVGVAGLATGTDTTWATAGLVVGVLTGAAALVSSRSVPTNAGPA